MATCLVLYRFERNFWFFFHNNSLILFAEDLSELEQEMNEKQLRERQVKRDTKSWHKAIPNIIKKES